MQHLTAELRDFIRHVASKPLLDLVQNLLGSIRLKKKHQTTLQNFLFDPQNLNTHVCANNSYDKNLQQLHQSPYGGRNAIVQIAPFLAHVQPDKPIERIVAQRRKTNENVANNEQ